MKVIICPGVHEGKLSDRFIAALQFSATDCEYLLFPTEKYPAYSPFHLWQWLQLQSIEREELLFISFLYAWLASDYGNLLITRCSYGSVILEVDLGMFSSVSIPLPDKTTINKIGDLVLKANQLRDDAWNKEQSAIKQLENMIKAK